MWSSIMLLLILVAIPVTLWLAKRLPGFARRGGGTLQVIETLSVGPRERLIVVHTGTEYLLMSATGQNLSLIKVLNDYLPKNPSGGDFKSTLQRIRSSQPDGGK
ncbi:MAG: flagellar biosynthetic protein FliO [Burkholderiaceae bacterium]